MTTYAARTISVSVDASADAVYRYASDPTNLPAWAPGFATSVRRDNDQWVVETGDGEAFIRFADDNAFGVLDHRVWDDGGLEVMSRMRVIANGDGCELLFTLFQSPDLSEDAFEADCAAVTSDLQLLKRLMEDAAG